MKKHIVVFVSILLACCVCGCLPQTGSPPGAPQATTPRPALTGVSAVGTASPSVSLSPTAPGTAKSSASAASTAPVGKSADEKALKRDLDFLISQSDYQRGQEENYKNAGKKQLITIEGVTVKQLRFKGKPQVFNGDYTGQFTAGKSYPYFEDASAGGKRYYNVKDNFGVWVIFMYKVPI